MKKKSMMQLKVKINHLCLTSVEAAKALEISNSSLYFVERQRNEATKL